MNWNRWVGFLLLVASLSFVQCGFSQLSTEDHLAETGFWPRQNTSSSDAYAGSRTCAKCHGSVVASQDLSRMARAAMPASTAELLHLHPDLSFRSDQYLYRIQTNSAKGGYQSRYSISDQVEDRSVPLLWAFGAGRVAQSYLFRKHDELYEARITYYQSSGALAFTPARALSAPSDIQEAMSRLVPAPEVARCFSCHSTGSAVGGKFDETHLEPGIKCEACHGPGLNHVNAMNAEITGKNSKGDGLQIYSPAHLVPTESIEFCGACHGSWWDVKLSNVKGVATTRSAPYRLATSKCWGKGDDARLKCTGCHDPHQPLESRSETYDAVCLQCHVLRTNTKGSPNTASPHTVSNAARIGAACPVETQKCTSCHMPKTYVPDMRDSFTDHRIRVVRAGETFPE